MAKCSNNPLVVYVYLQSAQRLSRRAQQTSVSLNTVAPGEIWWSIAIYARNETNCLPIMRCVQCFGCWIPQALTSYTHQVVSEVRSQSHPWDLKCLCGCQHPGEHLRYQECSTMMESQWLGQSLNLSSVRNARVPFWHPPHHAHRLLPSQATAAFNWPRF